MAHDYAVPISDFIGKTFVKIELDDNDSVTFICADRTRYIMQHDYHCCESVTLDDVCGEWADIIGFPILDAYESKNADVPKDGERVDSFSWSFYNITTIKGTVTLRWYGESNGYYSESVDIEKFSPIKPGSDIAKISIIDLARWHLCIVYMDGRTREEFFATGQEAIERKDKYIDGLVCN